MEKKITKEAKPLSKKEMKAIQGGRIPCTVYTDCPGYCTGDLVEGNMCIGGYCVYHICP
jgi:bacteriocin-like protein